MPRDYLGESGTINVIRGIPRSMAISWRCGIGKKPNHHHQVQFSSTNWNIASWRSCVASQMVLKLWKCWFNGLDHTFIIVRSNSLPICSVSLLSIVVLAIQSSLSRSGSNPSEQARLNFVERCDPWWSITYCFQHYQILTSTWLNCFFVIVPVNN